MFKRLIFILSFLWAYSANAAYTPLTVTDGTHSVTATTTLTTGNGFVVSGSAGSATINQTVADITKTSSYTVVPTDMGQLLNLGGSGATLTLNQSGSCASSTCFFPGMSLGISVTASASWTLTNSTGLTLTGLNSTTLLPGTSGTFIANSDGTHLDFFPGMQAPSTTILGGLLAQASATTHNFLTYIDASGVQHVAQPTCSDLSNGATGCSTATGTSGATIPILNSAPTTTASTETFGNEFNPSTVLPGSSTSGGITSAEKILQTITGNGSNVSGGDNLAFYAVNSFNGTGTMPYLKGVEANANNASANTVTLGQSFFTNISNGGGGTYTTAIMYDGTLGTNNGTVGTLIHYNCSAKGAGASAASTEYCLFSSDATQPISIAGNITGATFLPTSSTAPAAAGIYESGGNTVAAGSSGSKVMSWNSAGGSNVAGYTVQASTTPAITCQATKGTVTDVNCNLIPTGAGHLQENGTNVILNGGAGGTPSSLTLTNATGLPNNNVLAVTLATGTSVSLTAPRQYYVCTGTCTVTPPVPAAGYEFCIMNGDNVATVITMAALGSSARYENTARTAYGTAGIGTFVSGGAVGDKVCIVGLDSTHYLTTSFNGTFTAN